MKKKMPFTIRFQFQKILGWNNFIKLYVLYSIFRSLNLFLLDTVTGEIHVAKSLDRETLNRHVLKVTAYERLDPSISASTTVIVDLIDVQDNSPVFERNSYFAEIREDAPVKFNYF